MEILEAEKKGSMDSLDILGLDDENKGSLYKLIEFLPLPVIYMIGSSKKKVRFLFTGFDNISEEVPYHQLQRSVV